MGSSTAKKVVVRRFERESLSGFVNVLSYLQPLHAELLRPDGSLALIPYEEIKSISFVKEFEGDDDTGRIFLTRPKMEGLWVRLSFRDGEVMDGILPNELLAGDVAGFMVTPPEPDGNSQKVFVPRQALKSAQVLGVVGSPLRVRRKKGEVSEDQGQLF